jgi:phenylacetate-CoA ligase
MLNTHAIDSTLAAMPLYTGYPAGLALDHPDDLVRLPIIDKRHLSGQFPRAWMTEALKQAIAEDRVEYASTSGTSGEKLQIVRDRDWWLEEYARMYKHHPDLVQFRPGRDRKAILTTALCSSAVCWRTNPGYEDRILHATLYLNTARDPNRWTRAEVAQIVEEIERWQPEYIDCHAGYGAILARKATAFGIAPPRHAPRLLTMGYDFTPLAARQAVSAFFGAPAYEAYGATEFGYAYIETPDGLQPVRDSSIHELLPVETRPDLRRLVITTFKNRLMPLIRYDTGDLFEIEQDGGGRAVPTVIAGRLKDSTRNDDGRILTPRDLDRLLSASGRPPADYQLLVGPARALLKLVDAPEPAPFLDAMRELLGPARQVSVENVSQIVPEASGKFARIKSL